MIDEHGSFDPNFIQIRIGCLQAQRNWTPAERRKRLRGKTNDKAPGEEPYTVPIVHWQTEWGDPNAMEAS
jgi:hypothetical protein